MKKRSVRIVGAVTAAFTLAASMPAAFAAEADQEKLILEVKNRVGIPEEYTEFSASEKFGTGADATYRFIWSTADEEDPKSIDVTCREDGFVTSYRTSYGDYGMYDSLTMDETKAADAALDFVVSADPELTGVASLERVNGYSYGGITYSINAEFYGIGYYRSIGTVTVDSDYEVFELNVTLPDVPEPDASAKYLSAEEGVAAYRDSVGAKTVYKTYYDDEGELSVFAAYVSKDGEAADAVTGEAVKIGPDSPKLYGANSEAAMSADASGGSSSGYSDLTESEIEQLAVINSLISESDAAAIVSERTGIVPETENTMLYMDGRERYFYTLRAESSSVTMDAKTGDILSVYIHSADDAAVFAGYDFGDEALVKQLIDTLAPSYAGMYEYNGGDETDDPNRVISDFVYKVNGIEVEGAYASASRNVYEGGANYSVNISSLDEYLELEYPAPDTFTSLDSLVFSDSSYVSLKYADTPDGIKPVYISEQYTKNAVTGAEVDYRNEEYDPDGPEYTDIENHWVRYAAEKLAGLGIGFESGELRPDEAATADDAKELFGSIYGDYNDTVSAIDGGGAPVTRLEAAEIIIGCEGLEELARMDIYAQPYSDITENYGVTAILKGYGVIDGSVGTFRPNDSLTRAELLQLAYNTLVSFNE